MSKRFSTRPECGCETKETCTEEKNWELDEFGHVRTDVQTGCRTKMQDGKLHKTVYDEHQSFIGIFSEGDFKVRLIEEGGNELSLSVMAKMAGKNIRILLLSNDKLYVVHDDRGIIKYTQELDAVKLNNLDALTKDLQKRIGNTETLKTKEKRDLASAVNELVSIVSSPRRLVGHFTWLITDNKPITNIRLNDLEIAFDAFEGKWKYYSEAAKELIPLPEGWQKAKHFLRTDETLRRQGKIGDIAVILEDEKTYVFNGQKWVEQEVRDEVGDEYVARFVLSNGSIGSVSSTVILTMKGWTYTMYK